MNAKRWMTLAGLAAILSTSLPATESSKQTLSPDEQIAQRVAREIRMYSRYTIWDNVNVSVAEGQVELSGQVSQPFKKKDMERLALNVPGVKGIANQLEVLPTSFYDDELRIRVARAIYRDPALSRYAIQAYPPIHVIVKNGQVTLEGVVNNELEKTVAFQRASTAGLNFGEVVNNLRVEQGKKNG